MQVLSIKERRAMEEEKEKLSTVLMSSIPALMSKVRCHQLMLWYM